MAELRSQQQALAQEHARALHQAADAGAATEETQAALQARQDDMEEQRTTAAAALAARDSSYDLHHRRKSELEDKLKTARGTAPSIQARIDDLTGHADRLNAAADAARATAQAARLLDEHTTNAEQAAPSHGFDTPKDAKQALLTDDELKTIDQDIAQWHRDRAAHEAVLSNPEVIAAAAQPPVDTEGAENTVSRAEATHTNASAQAHAATTRNTNLTALTGDLTAHITRLKPLEDDHAVADQLATLAAGTSPNTVRMQLEAYVLAARLEEVVDAANTRLHRMSEGRFTLSHTDAKAAHGARSGLGLRITDAWTGHPRGTETLSGGESFFASLALALGLADVVTQESGGNPLDTLFIDEGFGTLDEDTLHKVLDVLDALRAGDRTVGLISHVTELRRRIPHRLHVRKQTSGSTLTLLTENAE